VRLGGPFGLEIHSGREHARNPTRVASANVLLGNVRAHSRDKPRLKVLSLLPTRRATDVMPPMQPATSSVVPRQGVREHVLRPSPADLGSLKSLMSYGRYPEAFRKAMAIFGVGFPGGFSHQYVEDSFPYPDDAITLPERRIVLVTINAFLSPSWLARTIVHERVHVQQYLRGDWGKPDSLGDWVNEVEAYDRTKLVAELLGLCAQEIVTDQQLRLSYFRKLDASYRMRIAGANYAIKDGDRASGAPIPG
jgi:hypothetical protein